MSPILKGLQSFPGRAQRFKSRHQSQRDKRRSAANKKAEKKAVEENMAE